MFIINLTYIVPLEELDQHMAEHVSYLDKYYEEGIFVASGRKVPRNGGIILALADSKDTIEQIIKEDPFYIHELAEFDITEFLTSKYHPHLKNLLS
ncbi:YciI family protein [Mucilaginibacter xinganensis]|uniref:GTP cyclohydrolase n=1 Tax=Mucilaginibacter xinganensis TaxID=1234841 RepID=A0A223NTX4_9SPHI|nr:YciI family protein [Mucilaginibacter xinganensis]ASU33345.1 GTP cyclohydrolase [Mucilaginibacter xinganensis]